MTTANKRGCCKVCADARRPQIDAALLLRTLRDVEREFSLSRSTLAKHKKKHVRGALEAGIAKATAAYTRGLRKYLSQVQGEVLAVLTAARTKGDSATALEAAREARAIAETSRKLLARSVEAKPNGKSAANPLPEIEVTYQGTSHVAE
jgi:hypothetical protein